MAAQFYKINYKSDFVLTINSDAGWAVPFCIKFWTGMPSHGYFAGFDGENYVNCRVGDTPTQLLVMFDDHHMPIGPLRMQIAYHTTIEEFPDRKFDEVTNPTNVTVDIDGTEYQVMLDFTGETGAEIDFSMPSSGVMSVNGKIGYVTLNAEDVGAQPTIEDLATIRSGAAEGATAVQPAEMTAALATKQDTIPDLATIRSGAALGATAVRPSELQQGLATKQNVIEDLSTIRSGAAAGATAVQPSALQERLATKQDVISDLSIIRSGAAAGATAVQPAAMNTALAAKQDTLTFDNTPTANSSNPVKSSGIKTALDAKQSTISTVNVTVDNNTGTPSGSASVIGSTLSLSFQNLKGATGATGATGPQGPQGERGLPGESGVTGDVSGFTVIQTIDPSATYGATDIAGAATVQATNAELTELGVDIQKQHPYDYYFAYGWCEKINVSPRNTFVISNASLKNGHTYKIRLLTATPFTPTADTTLKVMTKDSGASIKQIAQLQNTTVKDNIYSFTWDGEDGDEYRIGFYTAGQTPSESPVHLWISQDFIGEIEDKIIDSTTNVLDIDNWINGSLTPNVSYIYDNKRIIGTVPANEIEYRYLVNDGYQVAIRFLSDPQFVNPEDILNANVIYFSNAWLGGKGTVAAPVGTKSAIFILRKVNNGTISPTEGLNFKLQSSHSELISGMQSEINEMQSTIGGIVSGDGTYTGQKLSLGGRYPYKRNIWKTINIPKYAQSIAIHNNYIVFFYGDNVGASIWDLTTLTKLSDLTFDNGGFSTPHGNVMCFGNEYAAGNTILPLLYVSQWDGEGGCLVYDINTDGTNWTCTLVQTIMTSNIPQDIFGSRLGDWVVDKDNDCIWSVKYHLDSSITEEGNYDQLCKFNLPKLTEGSNIVLTEADIKDSFFIPFTKYGQDKIINDGIIYIAAGTTNNTAPRIIYAVDTIRHSLISKIDISDINDEPQGIEITDDGLILGYGYDYTKLYVITT